MLSGKENELGITPTTVWGLPLIFTALPTISGSAWKLCRQRPSEMQDNFRTAHFAFLLSERAAQQRLCTQHGKQIGRGARGDDTLRTIVALDHGHVFGIGRNRLQLL